MQVFLYFFFFRFVILNLLFVEGIKIFCFTRFLPCCCSLSCCSCSCCWCCCFCCLVPLPVACGLCCCVSRVLPLALLFLVSLRQVPIRIHFDSLFFLFRFCIFQFLFYGFNSSCCCCYHCFVSVSVDSSHMNLCLIFHLSWVCLLKLAHVAYVWYVCVYLHCEMALLLLSNPTLPLTHSPRTSSLPLPLPLRFSLSHFVDILVASCGFVLPIWTCCCCFVFFWFARLLTGCLSANSLCFSPFSSTRIVGRQQQLFPHSFHIWVTGPCDYSVTNLARFESRSSINCRQIVFFFRGLFTRLIRETHKNVC